ncbi:CAP domain-containing protein [Janthinobacterium fluminis]|uniref:CAP domain-containing protein n=1 Tax=Janthinobacterium fluminis TaxID=2987524 RepID=A0ABT5JZI7_9BURK|nr:CAP domain-containing protein [Janthinobacterium fluminis]MDC8758148.1 CAP domain-containing protein [Janthinobacterium fluminis]
MVRLQRWHLPVPALLLAALLSACGGGGGGGSTAAVPSGPTNTVPPEAGAPALTGNTATDGFNWINFRRAQVGLPLALTRNALIDQAAQNHSDYQRLNTTITHDEVSGKAGFTGVDQLKRLSYVGYTATPPYIFGEVIARAGNASGTYLAEQLITAIYHRFIIFEPLFKEAGSGAAASSSGDIYFTTNFGANNGYGAGIGRGKLVLYPFSGQTGVQVNFFSDSEEPDPVPNQNEVGYPISVHADLSGTLEVNSFTVRQRGAAAVLPVRLLTAATDPETKLAGPASAAIIPLAPLLAGTTYDVTFSGRVDSVDVTRSWSFATR